MIPWNLILIDRFTLYDFIYVLDSIRGALYDMKIYMILSLHAWFLCFSNVVYDINAYV